MSNKRIIWTNPDGAVSVLVPAPGVPDAVWMKDVPADAVNPIAAIVEDLPTDRLFRSAWKVDGRKCVECPVKAKAVAHDLRRALREREFAPHDAAVAKAIPGMAEAAESERANIRLKYEAVQADLDNCSSPDELRAILGPLLAAE